MVATYLGEGPGEVVMDVNDTSQYSGFGQECGGPYTTSGNSSYRGHKEVTYRSNEYNPDYVIGGLNVYLNEKTKTMSIGMSGRIEVQHRYYNSSDGQHGPMPRDVSIFKDVEIEYPGFNNSTFEVPYHEVNDGPNAKRYKAEFNFVFRFGPNRSRGNGHMVCRILRKLKK
jgi:hypothetical protein